MIRRERLRRTRQFGMPEISLTPLIDTALVLLVIFMITSPMMHNAVKVTLPKGEVNEAPADEPEPITVSIDKQERIFVNNDQVDMTKLRRIIEKLILAKKRPVYVYGDKAILYNTLMEVINSIKSITGVDDVILVTDKE